MQRLMICYLSTSIQLATEIDNNKQSKYTHIASYELCLIQCLHLARLIIIKFKTALALLWVHAYISIIICAIAFIGACLSSIALKRLFIKQFIF